MSMVEEMANISTLAEDLKSSTVAVRLRINRWGVKRALDDPQNMRAANEFDAKSKYVSASKKLIDTENPRYKAIGAVLTKARKLWAEMTVPYPEDGLRLLRTDRVDEFEDFLNDFRTQLQVAVQDFKDDYYYVVQKAREDLGDLYYPGDYPSDVSQFFKIRHEYCDVNPAQHLKTLHPEIYAREQQRVRAHFESAIEMAEAAFLKELNDLLEHCVEKLTDADASGKCKKFNDSLIGNFREFVNRFAKLDVKSNDELSKVVNQLKAITAGTSPNLLRRSNGFREAFREHMEVAKQAINGMIVDRPKRRFAD